MATIGDLVARLRLSNDNWQKNMSDSQRSTRQLEYDTEKLRRSSLQMEDTANRLGRAMANPSARAAEWARVQAKSNLEVMQARQANDRLSAGLANHAVQANQVTLAQLALDGQLMQTQQQLQLLTATQGTAAIQSKQLTVAETESALALQQARGATAQLAAQSQSAALFQTQLATSVEQSHQAVIAGQASNRQFAATMNNAAIQANRLALAEQESARKAMEMKSATALMTAQAGSASIEQSELTIAVERSNQAVAKERAELALLKRSMNDTTIQTNQLELAQIRMQKSLYENQSALRLTGMSTGKTQLAISQLIFAVDDASTVYGTSGLAGAVRAGANNLTMFAGLVGGPVALGIAVAVSAGVQLYLMMNKNADATENAKKAEEAYQEQLNKRHAVIEAVTRATQEGRGLNSVDELQNSIDQRQDDIEVSRGKEVSGRDEYEARKSEIADLTKRRDAMAAKGGYLDYLMGGVSHVHMNVMAELEKRIAELQGQQNATAKDINQNVEERRQKEAEINALMAERDGIMKREQQAQDEANRKTLNDLGAQMRGQLGQDAPGGEFRRTMAELYQRRDTIDSLAGGSEYNQLNEQSNQLALQSLRSQSLDVIKSIEGAAKPKEAKQRSAVEEFNRQQELIKLYAPQEDQAGLLAMAQRTALRAFRDPQGPVKGPSGLEQGSREALERIRQRDLDAGKPKQTQEQLMKEFLKKQDQLKEQEAKQTTWLEKIYLAQPEASDLR